ncbi:MAG: sugar ABC transporter permease [Oscillospiraceae bacterium]|nr:sugar ABC transporter permease [Oscillospiraceae bacterium]
MRTVLKRINQYYVPAIMVLPAVAMIIFMFFSPIAQSVYLSFFDWNGILRVPMRPVGLNNYRTMFHDAAFQTSVKNIGLFLLQGILLQGPVAFILALFISNRKRGMRYFKFTFFLPVVIPLTAIAIMWRFILNPNWGLINPIIRFFNPAFNADFLGNPQIAMYSVVTVSAWVYVGLNMIIFSAGMAAIPKELYESAEIDGATGLRQVRSITLPLMMESIKVYIILMVTGSLKTFDLVFVMTRGGPNESTMVPAVMMYLQTFSYSKFGYGATIATFILVTGLIGSLIANRYLFTKD